MGEEKDSGFKGSLRRYLAKGGSWIWVGLKLLLTAVGLVLLFVVSLWPISLLTTTWQPTGAWLVPYFLIAGSLALVFVALLALPSGREWITKPENVGTRFPYWFVAWVAFSLIILAIDLFATFTWEVLGDSGQLMATGDKQLSQEVLMDFYLWQALQFVPFVEVTETLDWEVPATYTGAGVGWLVLLFKAAIVVPILLAIRHFFGIYRDGVEATKAAEA